MSIDQAAADADLHAFEVLQRIDRALGVEDLARAVGEHAHQVQALVLVELGEHAVVDALVGDRNGFRGVAEERKFRDVGRDEAARRVAVRGEREVGESVADRVERLRRRDHGLGQQVAFHAALRGGFHVLAERHEHVGRDQVRRRHPGTGIQGDVLRGCGRGRREQRQRERADNELVLHAYPPRVLFYATIRAQTGAGINRHSLAHKTPMAGIYPGHCSIRRLSAATESSSPAWCRD